MQYSRLPAFLASVALIALAFPAHAEAPAEEGPVKEVKPKPGIDLPGAKKPDIKPDGPPPVVKQGKTDGRVLPPKTNKVVEAAFARAAPTFALEFAKIEKVTVQAKVCTTAEPKVCVEMTLGDPKADCKGDKVDAWCVTFKAAPSDEHKAALLKALGEDKDAAVWAVAQHKPQEGHKPGTGNPDNMSAAATVNVDMGQAPTEMPEAEMSDPSLLLLLAAAFGVLIAAVALFRMRGDDDEEGGEGES